MALASGGVCYLPTVARLTTEKNRTIAYTLIFAASLASSAVGGLLCGSILHWISMAGIKVQPIAINQMILLASCFVAALAVIPALVLRVPPPQQNMQAVKNEPHVKRRLHVSPALIRALLPVTLWAIVLAAFFPFGNLYLARSLHLSLARISVIFSIAQIVQLAMLGLAPVILRRLGLPNGLLAIQIATGATLALLACTNRETPAVVLFLFFGALQWMASPGLYDLAMTSTPDAQREYATAALLFCNALVSALTTPIAGALYTRFDYRLPMIWIALLAFLIAALTRFLLRTPSISEGAEEQPAVTHGSNHRKASMKRVLGWMLAASLLSLPLSASAAQPRHVDLLCHRTANEDMPENTLESLEQAVLLGCDVVEVDLRRTLDGKIVLNHDGFLERLTDGHGEVESTFYDDLRMRDAGSWMSDRFAGLRIVPFEDALSFARDHGIRLYLDMKDKGMGAEILAILRREGMLDRVDFGGEWDDVKALYPQANQSARDTQWVSPEITPEKIAALHRGGKRVVVNFSANQYAMDLSRMTAVVTAGADAINVDFPRIGADAVGRPVEARLLRLMQQANHGTSEQRAKAILELGRYQGFPLTSVFVHGLLDQDESVSRAAAVALVEMRPRVEPALFAEALRSPHLSARVNAAWALGELHAPASTVVALLNDRSPQVLSETLVALAHMPGNVPAESLLPHLSHPDSSVRGAAAVALARHQPIVAAREVPKQLRREAAAEEAVYHRHRANGGGHFSQAEIDAVVPLYRCQMQMLRALHISNQPAGTDELAEEAFGLDDVFPEPNGAVAAMMLWDRIAADPAAVVQQLSSEDTQAAGRAEWILVKAGPAVLPSVRKMLQSEKQETRQRAIRIVAWQGDRDSLDRLQILRSMNGPDAALAAWAIAKIEMLNPEP